MSQGYDSTPIRKNQFILEISAFSLSFWYAIIGKRDVEGAVPYKNRKGWGVMEFTVRKPNRLTEYDYNQNGAYFITICTQDRKKILSDIVGDDAHIVPKPYGSIAEKYIRNVPEITKYVIMPDHIHMIIRLDNGSMWASTPTKV